MYEALSLEGKVALITGGAGGIGQATAELMVGRGARVAIADLALERARTVADRFGDRAVAVGVDLGDEASIKSMVARVARHFGRIDILHNNAAAVGAALVAADRTIGEMDAAVWDTFFNVNCRGTMIVTREALPYLIETGNGAIVNTVSGMALQGNIRYAAYSATKAALMQLTRSTATAYGRKGVRCNAVAPEDIAEAVAFLASAAARNITGQTLVADGGVSIHIPGFAAYRKAFEE